MMTSSVHKVVRRRRMHYEGDLDIRACRKGVWTSQITLIRTAGRGLPVCHAAYGAPTTVEEEKVTCKRCLELIEKAVDTSINAPIRKG